MRPTSIMRQCLFAVVGISLSVLVMELLLRGIEQTPAWQVLPVVERELGWPDPDFGYALRANRQIINVREHRSRVTTNGFGMRDRERQATKSSAIFRVMLTGDSFTEALQVEDDETFAHLAEVELNAKNGSRQFEIFNFGMSGAGPVQQLVRAQHAARRYSPDALVMLIDINQFATKELSDDSQNPAYVKDENGGYKLGYAFRQSRSQRYRDSPMGKLFLQLMDESRIARAGYLRYIQAGAATSFNPPRARKKPRPCASADARFEKFIERWEVNSPTTVASLSARFLSDLATLTKSANLRTAIVFYGIGGLREECVAAMARRAELMSQLRQSVEAHGLTIWDADGEIDAARDPVEPDLALRGFGRQLGVGHLNLIGHRHFAQLMVSVVTALTEMEPATSSY